MLIFLFKKCVDFAFWFFACVCHVIVINFVFLLHVKVFAVFLKICYVFFSSEDPIYAKKYSEVPDSFVTKVDINLLLVIMRSYSGVNSK